MLSIPFLVFVVVIYAGAVVGMGVDPGGSAFSVSVPSGAAIRFSVGDAIVLFGLFVMFVEIAKSTRTGTASVVDHVLSVGLFIACLLALLLWAPFGTSTFMLITVMTLIDSIAGFTVTIASARRDFGVDPTLR